jgi:large subunit ribosomal protein L4
MKATIYTTKGTEAGSFELPEAVFGAKWNADLIHEVVRGGGKKPWKQKGTGRARHGSRRSPIWRGGGTTHGPLAEKDYSKKINKNARAKALAVALSKKFADGEVLLVDALSFTAPKAKDARAALVGLSAVKGAASLATKRKNAALVVLPARNEHAEKSFRNFGNVEVAHAKDINPVEVLGHKYVVIADPKASVAVLATRVGGNVTK